MKQILVALLIVALPGLPRHGAPADIVAAQLSPGHKAPAAVTHVLFVTMDGMRWQELFGGMRPELLTKKEGGVSDPAPLEKRFGGATPEERRAKLVKAGVAVGIGSAAIVAALLYASKVKKKPKR